MIDLDLKNMPIYFLIKKQMVLDMDLSENTTAIPQVIIYQYNVSILVQRIVFSCNKLNYYHSIVAQKEKLQSKV